MPVSTPTTDLLLPLPGLDEPPVPEFPGEYVTLAGTRLYVCRTAEDVLAEGAETAVYVHGLGGSTAHWTDLMYVLSPRLRGVAVDLPGFGHSGPPADGSYSPGAHARAVARLIEAEEVGAVHLFGNSLGGSVATLVAARRPELVRSLTLISPAVPFFRPRRAHLLMATGLASPLSRQLRRQSQRGGRDSAPEMADMMVRMMFATPARMNEQRRQAVEDDVRRRADVPWAEEAFSRSLRALLLRFGPGPANLWAAAREVRAPTLVILGSQDRLIDVEVAGGIARTYRNSRVVIEGDLGHVPQMERPEAVAALVADNLDEVARLS